MSYLPLFGFYAIYAKLEFVLVSQKNVFDEFLFEAQNEPIFFADVMTIFRYCPISPLIEAFYFCFRNVCFKPNSTELPFVVLRGTD